MNDQDWGAPESEILETIRRVQKSNSQAVIAHVVSVEGSAYRRPGAKMVVSENRVGIGNITAGCLEGEVLDMASEVLATGNPLIQTYDLMQDRDDMWGLGVGCNGVIDILLEQIDSSYQPILDSLDQGKPIGVITVLSGDVPIGTKAYYDEDTGFNPSENFPDWLSNEVEPIISSLIKKGKSTSSHVETSSGQARIFMDSILPVPRLVIVGSGNDVAPVVDVAKINGFSVSIISFRKGTDISEKFPNADHFHYSSPTSISSTFNFDNNTYVVIMTHNFIDDRLSLEQLVSTPVNYIGLLGPQERFAEMLSEFEAEGTNISPHADKIYTPIGLDIGGGSPYQIATSIISEILSAHNHRPSGHLRDRQGPIHDR